MRLWKVRKRQRVRECLAILKTETRRIEDGGADDGGFEQAIRFLRVALWECAHGRDMTDADVTNAAVNGGAK